MVPFCPVLTIILPFILYNNFSWGLVNALQVTQRQLLHQVRYEAASASPLPLSKNKLKPTTDKKTFMKSRFSLEYIELLGGKKNAQQNIVDFNIQQSNFMHVTAVCVLFNTIIRLSTFILVIPTLLSQTHPTIYSSFYNVYAGKYG